MRPEDNRWIRKRIDTTLDNFRSIYGCYVNGAKEIVTTMEIPVLDMETEEREMYAGMLKKVLSGTLERNLVDIEFPHDKVGEADEHKLLMALKSTQLKDSAMRDLLYSRIIENLEMDGDSYVILLAADTYDLKTKDVRDEEWSEESNEQFEYFICAICPVKTSKAALQYIAQEQEFRGISTGTLLAAPALGFIFPVLDEGGSDIYRTQYYSKSASINHSELISGLFMTERPPMAAEMQKETFNSVLAESLGDECSLDIVTSLQARMAAKAEDTEADGSKEIPRISIEDVEDILTDKGISAEKIKEFGVSAGERFDGAGDLNINNLIQKRAFEIKTPESKIVTDPANAVRLKTRTIEGVTYLLVPVGESVTVNGVDISVQYDEEINQSPDKA